MPLKLISQPHKTGPMLEEMERLKTEAIQIMETKFSYKSRAIVYTKDMRYHFALAQMETQEQARAMAIQISIAKQADFFIVVGLTKKPNEIDPNFTDFFLNIVGHRGDKVQYTKLKLMVCRDTGKVSIIDEKRNHSSLDKADDVAPLDPIIEQEDDFDEDLTDEMGVSPTVQ